MATVQEIQSGIVEKEDETKPVNFLEDIKIDGSDAMSLDRRFFSGATDRPDELRTDINNALGYRTFQTYYDKYVEDMKKFNPNAIIKNKSDFQEQADRGLVKDEDGNI